MFDINIATHARKIGQTTLQGLKELSKKSFFFFWKNPIPKLRLISFLGSTSGSFLQIIQSRTINSPLHCRIPTRFEISTCK